jgi:RNA polymerase sigma-70 factor, ECF subfamily
MPHDESCSYFADQLTAIQRGLYAYILTLLPSPGDASDVLQETNVVLWRDSARFEPGTDFRAWAYRVAYFQVLAQRRKKGRDRLRFDESLLKDIAKDIEHQAPEMEEEAMVLRGCLDKLPATDRELIACRYDAGVSVKLMATKLQQSPNAVAVRLFRIRQTLLDCVEQGASKQQEG